MFLLLIAVKNQNIEGWRINKITFSKWETWKNHLQNIKNSQLSFLCIIMQTRQKYIFSFKSKIWYLELVSVKERIKYVIFFLTLRVFKISNDVLLFTYKMIVHSQMTYFYVLPNYLSRIIYRTNLRIIWVLQKSNKHEFQG